MKRQGPRKYPTLPVVESVLREAGEPLRVMDIIRRAGDRLPTRSAQPRNVVSRDLSLDILKNPDSRFQRVATGLYALREAK